MKTDEEILKNYHLVVKTEKTVMLCTHCKGTGTYWREELTCYHRGEYDYFPEKCALCDGYGLLEEIRRRVEAVPMYVPGHLNELRPYNPKKNPVYKEE